ncbi:hypothetical protein OROHE_014608 [Orobanche hederae]
MMKVVIAFLFFFLLLKCAQKYADVLDPFSTGSSHSQPPEMTFQCLNFPIDSAARQNWKSKQTADGLILHMDMPGLGKDDVRISVEENTLIVKGEREKKSDDGGDDEMGRSYSNRVDLSGKLYKTNAIKAEMKNGVLKVFVPKMKEAERTDVFHRHELNLASKFTAKAISGRVQLARYMRVPIALRYGISGPTSSSFSSFGLNGSFSILSVLPTIGVLKGVALSMWNIFNTLSV